jgi:hypothetical protein
MKVTWLLCYLNILELSFPLNWSNFLLNPTTCDTIQEELRLFLAPNTLKAGSEIGKEKWLILAGSVVLIDLQAKVILRFLKV